MELLKRKIALIPLILLLLGLSPFQKIKAAEGDLYDFLWLDPDKQVYVLQNKVYKKDGKFYVNAGYAMGLNANYQKSSGFHVSTGYYFHEEWAVEVLYHKQTHSDDESYTLLKQLNGSVPFVRRMNSKYGIMPVWSPFYGKINTFNKIIYLDWSFGIGVGKINTESNATTVSNSNTAEVFTEEDNFAILMKTAFRVHVTKQFHVGLEYHRDNYRAPGPTIRNVPGTDSWRNNSEFIISIGLSF